MIEEETTAENTQAIDEVKQELITEEPVL